MRSFLFIFSIPFYWFANYFSSFSDGHLLIRWIPFLKHPNFHWAVQISVLKGRTSNHIQLNWQYHWFVFPNKIFIHLKFELVLSIIYDPNFPSWGLNFHSSEDCLQKTGLALPYNWYRTGVLYFAYLLSYLKSKITLR